MLLLLSEHKWENGKGTGRLTDVNRSLLLKRMFLDHDRELQGTKTRTQISNFGSKGIENELEREGNKGKFRIGRKAPSSSPATGGIGGGERVNLLENTRLNTFKWSRGL
ncbi:hypothetical protein TWF751_001343 [Orbilia oligospora]|nr:hypothetical protein TWF751_001343 [Orbilia oligospora]